MTENLTILEKASLLSGASVWDSRGVERAGIPSFVLTDGPHGVRRQTGSGDHLGLAASEPATCFPTAVSVANTWDPELAEEMGRALGEEARALGVDVLLGPGLNIKRSPLCGRNFEYFSEDPLLAGRMAAAMVRGIQSQGVAATPKHFAVNSQELRRMASDSVIDERTMRELYLTAFEIVVREAKPRALMTSYNLVNGVYANEHHHLLQEILRDEWGFDGMVVSDWGGSNDAVEAARAGSSLEMPAPGLDGARRIVRAVQEGSLPVEALDARAQEVIDIAMTAPSGQERPALDVEGHHALARKVAEHSIVLLRNEDALLPLAQGTSVAIIGDMAFTPRYQGSGSSQVNPTRLENTIDVLPASGLNVVGYARGYDRQGAPAPELASEAVDLASTAEVVVYYMGLDELAESEGLDRSHMRLADSQIDLLANLAAVNPKVVVVLSAGSAVEVDWLPLAGAVIYQGLSGQAGASAALRVMTGAVNPSGRLSETYPVRYADSPTSTWYPATGRIAAYREGPFVGYRYFETISQPVALPFGFGLSYSTFAYSDLKVTSTGATVTITNTSQVDGSDVVQLYVSGPGGVLRPALELKAFAKVDVPADESVQVTMPFDDYTFRNFDTATESWQVESGQWTIRVGAHVNDLPLHASLDVDGVAVDGPDLTLGAYLGGRVKEVSDAEFAVLLGRPAPTSHIPTQLGPNDPLSAMTSARSPLARAAGRFLEKRVTKAQAAGQPDLNSLFLLNMPLRAMSKMTNGLVSPHMVDGMVDVANGHAFRGLGTVISGFFSNARANSASTKELSNGTR